MHRSYFARIWTARQEGRSEQAIWSIMEKSVSDTNAKHVEERFARARERCLWGYANQKN
jgi:hypothetical protein